MPIIVRGRKNLFYMLRTVTQTACGPMPGLSRSDFFAAIGYKETPAYTTEEARRVCEKTSKTFHSLRVYHVNTKFFSHTGKTLVNMVVKCNGVSYGIRWQEGQRQTKSYIEK